MLPRPIAVMLRRAWPLWIVALMAGCNASSTPQCLMNLDIPTCVNKVLAKFTGATPGPSTSPTPDTPSVQVSITAKEIIFTCQNAPQGSPIDYVIVPHRANPAPAGGAPAAAAPAGSPVPSPGSGQLTVASTAADDEYVAQVQRSLLAPGGYDVFVYVQGTETPICVGSLNV